MAAADEPAKENAAARRARLLHTIAGHCAAERYSEAVAPAEELVALNKRDGRAEYGLAGLLARLGRTDEALKHLDRAVKRHDTCATLLKSDPDFANLRDDARFAAVAESADQDAAQEQARSKAVWTLRLPARYDKWKPAPLIVALHGFGGDAAGMAALWSRVADDVGAVLLTPEGQFDGPGGGKSWGTGDRNTAARQIMAAVADTRHRLFIDSERTVLTGFSQGGGMTYGVGLAYPESFRGLIPMAGPFVWGGDPAFREEKLKRLRIFIIVGSDDANAPLNREAAARFQNAGARVRLNVLQGLGHTLPAQPDELLHEALKYVWQPEPSTHPGR